LCEKSVCEKSVHGNPAGKSPGAIGGDIGAAFAGEADGGPASACMSGCGAGRPPIMLLIER